MTTAGLIVELVICAFFGMTNYVTEVMTTVEEVSQRANKHSHTHARRLPEVSLSTSSTEHRPYPRTVLLTTEEW